MNESVNFSELRNKINNWDLEAEEMLLTKIKNFTDNYLAEFNHFSRNLDSFDVNVNIAEVENYKAYSQLKSLSENQFIEDILEEKTEEQFPKEEENNNQEEQKQKEIIINDIESKRNAINLSLQNLQEIQAKKEKGREVIEDDTVSVSSSRLNLDTFSKYVRMPFIIGTQEFKNDKTIGLTIDKGENKEEESEKKDENDSEDSDVEEFVADIAVRDSVKAKWDKVKEKKKKKKEKEKIKQSKKVSETNIEFEDEKVKVPKETEDGFLVIENEDVNQNNNNTLETKNSASIPPPPPPPPPEPPKVQKQANQEINKDINNNVNNNNNENNNANNNNAIIMPKEDNNNQENNNENKEPIDINSVKQKKVDVKLANFLGGVDLFAEDEDEDMDDGLFSRKNRKIPVIPNPNLNQNNNQQPQMIQNQQPQMIPNQQPQIIPNQQPQIIPNQQPQMMPNQQPQMMPNQQPQMFQMPQINPLINLNNNSISNNLGNAKKKLKNMFGDSDDDDDDENPLNVDAKKEEKKIENNNIFQEDAKKVEVVEKKEDIQIKEEKKEEEKVKENKVEDKHKKKLLIIGDDEENNELKFEKKQSAKDQIVNSLFSLPEDEGEKNTSTKNVPVEQPNQIKDKKQSQKRLAFLFDDDD